MPSHFLKSSSVRRKQKAKAANNEPSKIESYKNNENELQENKKQASSGNRKLGQTKVRKTSSTSEKQKLKPSPESKSPNFVPDTLKSGSMAINIDFDPLTDKPKSGSLIDLSIQENSYGFTLDDQLKEKNIQEPNLVDENTEHRSIVSTLGNTSPHLNNNNLPNLNTDLQNTYHELLLKYEALLYLKETRSEALFREYKEAAEQRFKGIFNIHFY